MLQRAPPWLRAGYFTALSKGGGRQVGPEQLDVLRRRAQEQSIAWDWPVNRAADDLWLPLVGE